MNRPKPYVHTSSVEGYHVLRIGKIAIPTIILLIWTLGLYLALMVACATWDIAFDGDGAGVLLFVSVTGILILVGVIVGLVTGITKTIEITRQVNE